MAVHQPNITNMEVDDDIEDDIKEDDSLDELFDEQQDPVVHKKTEYERAIKTCQHLS